MSFCVNAAISTTIRLEGPAFHGNIKSRIIHVISWSAPPRVICDPNVSSYLGVSDCVGIINLSDKFALIITRFVKKACDLIQLSGRRDSGIKMEATAPLSCAGMGL